MVTADAAHVTSCLPVSCMPMVNTPFGYNVLLIVVFTAMGPHDALLVEVEPIKIPSKYKLTVVEVKLPVKVPDIEVADEAIAPVIVPHLPDEVGFTALQVSVFELVEQVPFVAVAKYDVSATAAYTAGIVPTLPVDHVPLL